VEHAIEKGCGVGDLLSSIDNLPVARFFAAQNPQNLTVFAKSSTLQRNSCEQSR
jgi:hypothetical protein